MSDLDGLGLTPAQLAELDREDPELVQAWLAAVQSHAGLKSPTGWFLAGVRTGQMPVTVEGEWERIAVRAAETRIRNIGALLPTRQDLIDELFTSHGALLQRYDSPELRARMVDRWRRTQPQEDEW